MVSGISLCSVVLGAVLCYKCLFGQAVGEWEDGSPIKDIFLDEGKIT